VDHAAHAPEGRNGRVDHAAHAPEGRNGRVDHAAHAPEGRNGRAGRDALFGALLFVLALAPRLYVALAWTGEPVWDGHYYDFGARRIAEGLGYSDDLTINGALVWHPWCHYPVGYSAFLAVFYRLFGAGHAVAAVANALVGACLAVATWALARRALSPLRARAAGLLVALHPGLILYAALVMSEPLAALLTILAFLAAVSLPPRRGLPAGALLLGVAAIVRPQALLCAPALALVFPRGRPRIAAAAVACALALVPVVPWTVRNCRVMDRCAFVSTNAGWNLAIGAFPRATGRFETLRSSDGCREVTGQVQQDRCWFDYGVAQIRARPWHWLSLVPAKLGFTFDHESFAVEYLHEARPEAWPEDVRARGRDVTTLAHRLLLAGAALGCIAFPALGRRRKTAAQGALLVVAGALVALAFTADTPVFWPLALFVAIVPWLPVPGRPPWPPELLLPVALLATTLVTHAVFFGEDRYHVVVTPVLALLAAAALRRPAPVPS
jgi:4-amino-4-deoxy-L-arabinose transferase-like glycosyltransferase